MAVRTFDHDLNQTAANKLRAAADEFHNQVYTPLTTAFADYQQANHFEDAVKVYEAGDKMSQDLKAMKDFFDTYASNLSTSSATIERTLSGSIK